MEPIRLVIADDHPFYREGIRTMLRTLPDIAVIGEATNGNEVIAQVFEQQPDVILMDIGMPRLNGYDAARRIRQEPWGHEVLMVATTGWGKEEDRRRSKEAGFDLHLVKPIDISAVQEVLASPARTQQGQPAPIA